MLHSPSVARHSRMPRDSDDLPVIAVGEVTANEADVDAVFAAIGATLADVRRLYAAGDRATAFARVTELARTMPDSVQRVLDGTRPLPDPKAIILAHALARHEEAERNKAKGDWRSNAQSLSATRRFDARAASNWLCAADTRFRDAIPPGVAQPTDYYGRAAAQWPHQAADALAAEGKLRKTEAGNYTYIPESAGA